MEDLGLISRSKCCILGKYLFLITWLILSYSKATLRLHEAMQFLPNGALSLESTHILQELIYLENNQITIIF